ncbi:MAG: KTSC domain-containing protein [Caulobacteraceae bacterium]|nr:KTSC domain-containing protein [Caulobacteraceae bacterium]
MPDYGDNDPWANHTPKNSYTPNPDKESKEYKQTKYWLDTLLEDSNEELDNFETDGPSSPMMPTTSTNPSRPRTIKAGYDFSTKTLTVVFRDGTWWEYREVPDFMWYDFMQAESKGKYLKESGLDTWPNAGLADVSKMPKSKRVLMSDLTEFLKYMYSPKRNDKEE